MTRIIYLILLLSISISISAKDYTIQGKVVDQKDKTGLSNINVGIQGTNKGTLTNRNGEFSLSGVAGEECILAVYAIGYETVLQTLKPGNNTGKLTIVLEEKPYELEQVVVTATRSERVLKDVPIATQVISRKTLEKMQISNFRDVLEYEMPGVEFTNNGGYANINMLGFGGKYVLFLVDGERMAGESFDNIDYNRINMDNIERMEIVKGASSSLYGSNAVGGVVNIITKKPDRPLQIQASGRYGSHGEQNASLLVSSLQKWGSMSLSGSYKTQDPYTLKDREALTQKYENGTIVEQALSETNIAGYEDYNITPKVTFTPNDKLEIELKGGYFFKERNPGGRDGEKVRDRFYDYTGGVKANYEISKNQHVSLSGNYDRYDKYDYYRLLKEKEKNYENSQIRVSGLYDLMIGGKHSIVAGAEYLSDDLMTYMFEKEGESDQRDAYTYSVFTQQEWVLHKKVTMVTGLRYDYHSRFKGHLTPRLSFMYRPNKILTLRGGYSGGFRSPTLKELYTDWFHPYGGGFQIIGNSDMKAETSNNFTVSGEVALGKTLITGMAQYSIIDEKINSVWLNNDTIQYVNQGNAKIFSSEVTVSHRFGKDVMVRGTYAYVHDNHKKRSTTRPHTATFRVDYTTNFLKKYNPTMSFSGKYFSGMDVYGTGDITEIDNTTGMSKTETEEYVVKYDGYSIWRLTLQVPLPYNLSVNGGINNLFDYKPKFSSFYSSISSGRTYYVGLTWRLK
ncbi:TonB-dependent receptor [Bacteroides sp. 51]|uniref:TonB-dependent receptor n=1 Tax=Bacteroides sp. 51 TaxID=2302938 RepID=UPI0013D0E637|nr:TonB-dependent receptor [Bacteroides sp. 51]NDV83362.1 TonB-dependent receptor [Bacteroides sp. 51]